MCLILYGTVVTIIDGFRAGTGCCDKELSSSGRLKPSRKSIAIIRNSLSIAAAESCGISRRKAVSEFEFVCESGIISPLVVAVIHLHCYAGWRESLIRVLKNACTPDYRFPDGLFVSF